MPIPDSHTVLNVILFVVALALGWTFLKALLKTTAKVTALGCLVVVIAAAVAWLVVRLA